MSDFFEELELSTVTDSGLPEDFNEDNKSGKTEVISGNSRNRKRPETKEYSTPAYGLTEIVLPADAKLDPAVGWLVCISGVDKGRSFRLIKGNNSIGRSGSGKSYAVELTDQQISRKGAAGVIVYNEKNNTFYITPGDLTTNINPYLNEEILLSPKQLSPRSILEVADDVLVFIPFCCDKFAWKYTDTEKPGRGVNKGTGDAFEYGAQTAASPANGMKAANTPGFVNDPDGKTVVF